MTQETLIRAKLLNNMIDHIAEDAKNCQDFIDDMEGHVFSIVCDHDPLKVPIPNTILEEVLQMVKAELITRLETFKRDFENL